LKETGEFDNTVIILLADNGASPERLTQPGYDRPSETRGGVPIRYTGFQTPGGETTYGGIGPWWANAANTPFRFWKKESFEGGVHTPCVIHWPSGLQLAAGSTIDELGHVMDVLPTCLDLAGGLKLTEELGISGQSLGPILRGERRLMTQPSERDLYFEHEGGRALISGEWKISALPNGDWELFKIQYDRTEASNLAGQHPEVVRNLHERWLEWAREVGVPQDVIQKAAGRQ
jgi:arylsulfatase